MAYEVDAALRQLVSELEDGVLLLDSQWTVLFSNEAASSLLELPPGPLTESPLWKLVPQLAGTAFEAVLCRAMKDRVALSESVTYPALSLHFGVQAVPTEGGLAVRLRNDTKQQAAEQDRAEAAAQVLGKKTAENDRQEAEIEGVYQTAPIGLALFDPVDFRYLRLNTTQAEFFGMTREAILGKRVTDLAPIEGVRELFEQVAGGQPIINFPLEGELVGRPGEYRYWTVNYFPVYDHDGKIQAITAASLEITQQKKAEMALMQSEKLAAVGRLASSISHEINNPLEAITNLLYIIAGQSDLTDQTKELVSTAQSELARVSQIATQTLKFHRQRAQASPVSAAELLDSVVTLYQGRLHNSNISVEKTYLSERPLLCLESEVRQVLNNLIGNAIDAMRTGGRLLVRAREVSSKGKQSLCLTIADSGTGMTPEVRKRIFEPFFTTKDINGNGLGLWISCEIVSRHQGNLQVRSSTGKRHGTVFRLVLPFEESHRRSMEQADPNP